MEDNKDCMYCKHSFYEDLDYNLCCKLKDNQILKGVLDEESEDCLHCIWEYSYPNVCEKFELEEVFKND